MGVEHAGGQLAAVRRLVSAARARRVTPLAALVVCYASLGCARHVPFSDRSERTSSASQRPTFAADDLKRIDATVAQAMSSTHTTGLSLAITHQGHLVFAKAYGRARPGSSEALTTTSRMRIASVSKALTAIEIMHLIEQGRLRLDQRVL